MSEDTTQHGATIGGGSRSDGTLVRTTTVGRLGRAQRDALTFAVETHAPRARRWDEGSTQHIATDDLPDVLRALMTTWEVACDNVEDGTDIGGEYRRERDACARLVVRLWEVTPGWARGLVTQYAANREALRGMGIDAPEPSRWDPQQRGDADPVGVRTPCSACTAPVDPGTAVEDVTGRAGCAVCRGRGWADMGRISEALADAWLEAETARMGTWSGTQTHRLFALVPDYGMGRPVLVDGRPLG